MSHSLIFTGVVVTSKAGSGAVAIQPESYGDVKSPDAGMMMQGMMVSSAISTFLGFRESAPPQPGSRVLCVGAGSSCYVIGALPPQTMADDDYSFASRAMLGAGCALGEDANRIGHGEHLHRVVDQRRPSDVVDGEYVMSNEFGVLLGLYQQLATLKASELAQVQCFLLDDLVRIISHNFQHYTAIGEYNIYHDGKTLLAEFGATHKPSETYGIPAVDDDSGNDKTFTATGEHSVDDASDFYAFSSDERIKAIERFKVFLGGVGDFIHMFVVRPDPNEKRILDPEGSIEKPDTGLADVHVGVDGGMHIRSVKEIFIEKTNWIRVPHRKAAPDDPKGDDAEEIEYDNKEKFEFIDEYKYKNNPFAYALQLRDYVAYVNEKLGYQNFKKHEKDFHVNDDISKENKLNEIGNIDQETKLNLEQYQLRTAGLYLMPNGGITIRDAWNSAIIMEGGNIYLQPAKDLISQPLRHNVVKAGGSVNIACREHMDLSSSEEGIRIKSEKAQYLYSNKSGFVIESNGTTDSPGTPDPKEEAIDNVGGIVLKSKLSIYNYAEKNIVAYAKKNLLLQSLNNTDIIADSTLTTYGKKSFLSLTDGSLFSFSKKGALVLSSGSAVFAGAKSTALGQDGQKLGVMYDKKSKFIDTLSGVMKVSEVANRVSDIRKAKNQVLEQTTFQTEEMFANLQFKFLASDKYHLQETEDGLPTTLAQQDDLLTDLYKLEEWEESEVNDTVPFPGKKLFENFYYKAEKPGNLEENKLGKDYSNKAASEKKPNKVTLASMAKYKVQPKQ
jgi:hypothetical protein